MTRQELVAAGFDVLPDGYARLARFVERLLDENQHINLTGTHDAAAYWAAHVCDSLSLLPTLLLYGVRRLIDVGSGGGLPGAVLACVRPELEVCLLDATRKKLEALRRVCADVGLANVDTLWGRAEHLAHDGRWRERFDAAGVRAVAAPPVACELASGFVRPGGITCLFVSVSAFEEQRDATRAAAARLSLADPVVRRVVLPAGKGERLLLAFEKTAPLDPRLPRDGSRIARGPLG